MEFKVLINKKEELKIELDNLTVAELLRVYLNKDDSVKLAVWRREHPEKSPVLLIQTKNKTAKKALNDAISKIEKELNSILKEFKELK